MYDLLYNQFHSFSKSEYINTENTSHTKQPFKKLFALAHHGVYANIKTMKYFVRIYYLHLIEIFNYSFIIFIGGCNLYGHSCFGGHGKRSDIPVSEGISLDAQIPIVKLLRESNRELLNSQYNLRNYNTNNDYKMDNFLSEQPKKNYQNGPGRLTGMEILRKWVKYNL